MDIKIKRIYASPEESDGKRVLIDRLWPRGISKERAQLDGWMKDAAPSPQLRIWFGHLSERFEDFADQYMAELDTDPLKQEAVRELLKINETDDLTLLYAAKSETINHAVILQKYLKKYTAQ